MTYSSSESPLENNGFEPRSGMYDEELRKFNWNLLLLQFALLESGSGIW